MVLEVFLLLLHRFPDELGDSADQYAGGLAAAVGVDAREIPFKLQLIHRVLVFPATFIRLSGAPFTEDIAYREMDQRCFDEIINLLNMERQSMR